MNKLWIFEVLSINSPQMWVGNTKTIIQHDLQRMSIFELLQSSLHAYFLPTHGNGEVPILGKLPEVPFRGI
jgi:hypothetical protein